MLQKGIDHKEDDYDFSEELRTAAIGWGIGTENKQAF